MDAAVRNDGLARGQTARALKITGLRIRKRSGSDVDEGAVIARRLEAVRAGAVI